MSLTEEQQDRVDELKAIVGDTSLDDDELWSILQASGSRYAAASEVWLRKSAEYGDLVDVSEGSSRRPLSQLRASAVAMAEKFADLASAEGVSVTNRTKLWRLTR